MTAGHRLLIERYAKCFFFVLAVCPSLMLVYNAECSAGRIKNAAARVRIGPRALTDQTGFVTFI